MTFSANAITADSTDSSIFANSQLLGGSAGGTNSMPGSQPVHAGTATYPVSAAGASPPTAVYINPAHQVNPQAQQNTAPKATKV